MNWNSISDGLPAVKQVVLLYWPVPDMPPIYRLGSLLHTPWLGEAPIWKFDLDYGDAGAWVFTNRGDEQPTHWAELTSPTLAQPPREASGAVEQPASSHSRPSVVEAGAAGQGEAR